MQLRNPFSFQRRVQFPSALRPTVSAVETEGIGV
jgi:hypothetical protein